MGGSAKWWIVALLLLPLLTPLSSAEEVTPPDQPYEPQIRTTVLFAEGQDSLSPSLKERPETSNHDFPLGAGSSASAGPTLTTPSFLRQAPTGSDEWNFSLWASGSGAVDIDLFLYIDGTELEQVNSGVIDLSEEPLRVDFAGANLPENISLDQTLSIRWEVSSQELPFITSSSCTIHWGSVDTPTNLTIEAGMYQFDQPYLESSGTPFRGDSENYSRSDVLWAVQARWALSEEQFEEGTIQLNIYDNGRIEQIAPTEWGVKSDGGVYKWLIEEWDDGVILSAEVAWNDTSGFSGESGRLTIMMDERGPSIVGGDTMRILYLLTFPMFAVIAWWLRGRYLSLLLTTDEDGEGPSHTEDLARMLSIGAFLVMGAGNALVLYSFHSRQLGAGEDMVVLHTGLLALSYGISGPFWGSIADRWGRRKEMLTITLGLSIAILIPLAFVPLGAFIGLTVLQTILFGSSRVAFAVGTEWYPRHKGEFIGLLYAVASLFAALAAMLGGKIYDILLDSQSASMAMLGVSIFSAVMLSLAVLQVKKLQGEEFILPFWKLRGEVVEEKVMEGWGDKIAVLRHLFRFESKWPLLVMLVVLLVAMPRGAVVLTSLRYFEVVGFDVDFSTLLEAWAVLAVLFLYAAIGRVCDNLGAERVLLWSALAYGTLWSIFSIGLPPMIAVMVFVIPIYPMLLVSNDALLARFTTDKERNRGLGMAGAVALAGQSLGIALGYLLMRLFLDSGMSDIDAYHTTYRVNILLWIVAVFATWRLFGMISAESEDSADDSPLQAEIA